MSTILAAADVGGTAIKLGFFTEQGELLKKWEIPTDISEHGKNILPDIGRSLRTAAKEAGDAKIAGLGVGIPGPVSENGVVEQCINLGWRRPVEIQKELEQLLPEVPLIRCGNDASVAALGELWMGAGKNYDSAYLITLGTGVGGGYATKGRIVYGAHGAAGEIGHLAVNIRETVPCVCGGHGCLEQYASANGLVRLAKNLLEYRDDTQTETSLHIERLFEFEKTELPAERSGLEELDRFTAKEICDLAREGDAFCKFVLKVFGDCLGLAMNYISCTIDPEVFLIGGGLSNAGEIVLDTIRRGYLRYAISACLETGIVRAQLGNDAGIYGCVRLLLPEA